MFSKRITHDFHFHLEYRKVATKKRETWFPTMLMVTTAWTMEKNSQTICNIYEHFRKHLCNYYYISDVFSFSTW